MRRFIVMLVILTGIMGAQVVEAEEIQSTASQTVYVEELGNARVVTTTDIATGVIVVEHSFHDEVNRVTNVTTTVNNTLTGEVTSQTEVVPDPRNIGYIYVGDSRYQGVDMYTGLSKEPNVWVFAEVSKGYRWLDGTASAKVDAVEAGNPGITDWVEIYTLGINDPGNMDKYSEWYKKRAVNHNVILLSMNPIEHHSSITNELVEKFNGRLKATGLSYIDCYGYLMEKGFKTSDGVHYNVETDKVINSFVHSRARQIAEQL